MGSWWQGSSPLSWQPSRCLRPSRRRLLRPPAAAAVQRPRWTPRRQSPASRPPPRRRSRRSRPRRSAAPTSQVRPRSDLGVARACAVARNVADCTLSNPVMHTLRHRLTLDTLPFYQSGLMSAACTRARVCPSRDVTPAPLHKLTGGTGLPALLKAADVALCDHVSRQAACLAALRTRVLDASQRAAAAVR